MVEISHEVNNTSVSLDLWRNSDQAGLIGNHIFIQLGTIWSL